MKHMVRHLVCLAAVAGLALGAFGGTTVYVDCASQGAAEPYATPQTAATTLTTALAYAVALGNEAFPVEIRVAKGTYAESGFVLNKPIAVVGDTGSPEDVVIEASVAGKRTFTLSHADARVEALTMLGTGVAGGHVSMSAGRVARCRILKAYISGGHGGGVYASGGTIESCLVKGNSGSTSAFVAGVALAGAALALNCTIVGNSGTAVNFNASRYARGACVEDARGQFVNCAIYDNGGTADTEFGNFNLGRFRNCASSVTNASCATWKVISSDDFADSAHGDYTLPSRSRLIDAGTDEGVTPSESDLAGRVRKSGAAYDIGCYEFDQSVFSFGGYFDSYATHEETNVNFTAAAYGPGTVKCKWDFGNGVTRVVDLGVTTYAYPTGGLFAVRLAASSDGGATWSAWQELPTKIVVVPLDIYVDDSCATPQVPYRTRETACTTFDDAFGMLTNNASAGKPAIGGVTIHVAAGDYSGAGYVLNNAIAVVGDTGNPEDVRIVADRANLRTFTLGHAGARLEALKMSGTGLSGGHVSMSAGLVENCIITGGRGGFGSNVNMSGGRVSRCQILNAYISSGHGGGVYATAGTIESCLVKGNSGSTSAFVAGVALAGAALALNCTIVGNSGTAVNFDASRYARGACVEDARGQFVNCVIYDNGGTADTEFGNFNPGRFQNCASSVTNASCATWKLVTTDDFVDSAHGDYTPTASSCLVDEGTDEQAASLTGPDLLGAKRLSGKQYDIGCYEYDQSQVTFGGYLLSYAAFEGSNITFVASARGSADPVYRWDFGNGVTNTLKDETFDYAYPASGLFTVRLTVSPDGGETWQEWQTLPLNVVVAPETVYVASTGATPTFPYKTPETACGSLDEAFAILTNSASAGRPCLSGVTLRIGPGSYEGTGYVLDVPIAVIGETGDPKDVEIVDSVTGSRAFTLSHADARLEAVTVSGTGMGGSCYGGHVNMTAGTVENCVIRGAEGAFRGGNVNMAGGRLVRCVIRDGRLSGNSGHGAGIFATGGLISDCLVTANGGSGPSFVGGIEAAGAVRIVNCTISGNWTGMLYSGNVAYPGGLHISSPSATVVNTLCYGNGSTTALDNNFGNSNLGRCFNCAAAAANSACSTWKVVNEDDFVDAANGDLHLTPSSRLVDTGTDDYAADLPSLDIDGNDRLSGSHYDIGCYEYDQSQFAFGGYAEGYAVHEGEPVAFVANSTGTETPAYRWDFGNGETRTTEEGRFEYAYPTSGLFTVTVSASPDRGTTWATAQTLATKVVVAPAEMFVKGDNAGAAFPYKTRATAARTLDDVFGALTNNASADKPALGGITVRVLPGVTSGSGMVLAHDIRVIGETGNPADVEIVSDVAGRRTFTLGHSDAVVSNVTVSGSGCGGKSGPGGHFNMSAGRIENCIIREGYSSGHGGNVYMTGGRLVRCQVLSGHITGGGSHGGGVYASGGIVESCLIRGNYGVGSTYTAGMELNNGAVAINCTVVGNYGTTVVVNTQRYGLGVTLQGSPSFVNGVLYDNGGTRETEYGNFNLARFAHCACSVTNDSCATWTVIDEKAFRNYAKGPSKLSGYGPKPQGPLVDAGCTVKEAVSTYRAIAERDLLGKPRAHGTALDLGCIESEQGCYLFVR